MNGRARRLGFGSALALSMLLFLAFWVLTWTSREHWVGTVLALQGVLLLFVFAGLLAGSRGGRPQPR